MASAPPADVPAASTAGEVSKESEGSLKGTAKGRQDEKEKRRANRAQQANELAAVVNAVAPNGACGEETFGYIPSGVKLERTGRVWTKVCDVNDKIEGEDVWLRGRLYQSRVKGKIGFVSLREGMFTVQCVIDVNKGVSPDLLKWTAAAPLECIVDVHGKVTVPSSPITSTTQSVEVELRRIFCLSRPTVGLPFQLKDANTPEDGEGIRVHQDVRLDHRVLDLRTFANQSMLRITTGVCKLYREFLLSNEFVEIHTPKLLGGSSEGGANVFNLSYFNQSACLSQSPQLHKQMAIGGDCDRVFEIGPVFRAENSNTHRHLCEFTGLDLEMTYKESYFEVIDFLEELFIHIFDGLTTQYKEHIEVIRQCYPTAPFKWLPKGQNPRITFTEGVELLRRNGAEGVPVDITEWDIGTEHEKLLGAAVKEQYGTDFFFMYEYPTAVRAFYSMPSYEDKRFANAYDLFMRGEEISSGAQRVTDYALLVERANECGMDVASPAAQSYLNAFRLGIPPHAGAGIGMERVVMLFLGLGNIRKVSMFPRDPSRLKP